MASQAPFRPRRDPEDQRKHREVLKRADAALEAFARGSKETRERLKRALAAYEERRRA